MREIKFRAWDKYAQELVNVKTFDLEVDGSVGCIVDYSGINLDASECILMQYTGLNDSEGVEIYEGDLLSIQIVRDAKKTVTIVFEDGAFGVKDELFGWGYGKEFYPLKTIINNHKVEVIGNIHENSELLEDK